MDKEFELIAEKDRMLFKSHRRNRRCIKFDC